MDNTRPIYLPPSTVIIPYDLNIQCLLIAWVLNIQENINVWPWP